MSWEHHADQIRSTVKIIEDACDRWQEPIFRGEPKKYDRPCCSTLWREYAYSDVLGFFDGTPKDSGTQLVTKVDLCAVQAQIVQEATEYSGDLNDEIDLATYLRHHGAPTNLIDFTSSVHIALFFACNDCHEEDGYIYIQNTAAVTGWIKQSNNLNRRATAQKSVFIESPRGFIDPPYCVMIPKCIKDGMLEYLNLFYGVSARTVYYDLSGFIQNYSIRKSLQEGLQSGMRYEALKHQSLSGGTTNATTSNYDQLIIDNYSVVLTYDPTNYIAQNSRGIVLHDRGDYEKSISDFSKAVEIFPSDQSYSNLAMSHFRKGEYRMAVTALSKAIECFGSDRLYVKRGDAYYRNEEYDYAETDYISAKMSDELERVKYKWDLIASYKLAILRLKTRAYDAALEEINEVIERDKDAYLRNNSYCVRGIVFLCLKEWNNAERDLLRSRENGVRLDDLLRDDFQTITSFLTEVGVSPPREIRELLADIDDEG